MASNQFNQNYSPNNSPIMLKNAVVAVIDSCEFTENYSTQTSGVMTVIYNDNEITITN